MSEQADKFDEAARAVTEALKHEQADRREAEPVCENCGKDAAVGNHILQVSVGHPDWPSVYVCQEQASRRKAPWTAPASPSAYYRKLAKLIWKASQGRHVQEAAEEVLASEGVVDPETLALLNVKYIKQAAEVLWLEAHIIALRSNISPHVLDVIDESRGDKEVRDE